MASEGPPASQHTSMAACLLISCVRPARIIGWSSTTRIRLRAGALSVWFMLFWESSVETRLIVPVQCAGDARALSRLRFNPQFSSDDIRAVFHRMQAQTLAVGFRRFKTHAVITHAQFRFRPVRLHRDQNFAGLAVLQRVGHSFLADAI